jgi:iron donor protein CyaY
MIDEARFRQIVSSALANLSRQIDALDSDAFDSKTTEGVFQVDFEGGVVIVLSQQVPVRELWLSAFSKAWHFRWSEVGWLERDSGERLEAVVGAHLARGLGKPVRIEDPGP